MNRYYLGGPMKILIVTLLLVAAFVVAARRLFLVRAGHQVNEVSHTIPIAEATPPGLNEFKNLLFADQTLEEFATNFKIESAPADDDFSHYFALALSNSRKGNVDEAKKNLKQTLTIPHVEARVQLWAWKNLRQLGEKPPPNISGEVHGVVIEMPVENSLDTLAAYSDGSLRYINYTGKIFVWDAPDGRFGVLISRLLKSAEPLVNKTPALERHQELKTGFAQVSVLTFGGVHQESARESEISAGSKIDPIIMVGGQLVSALAIYQNEIKQTKEH